MINGLAKYHGLAATAVFAKGDGEQGTKNCLWMLLSKDPAAIELGKLEAVPLAKNDSRLLWTDDRSNLFEILR